LSLFRNEEFCFQPSTSLVKAHTRLVVVQIVIQVMALSKTQKVSLPCSRQCKYFSYGNSKNHDLTLETAFCICDICYALRDTDRDTGAGLLSSPADPPCSRHQRGPVCFSRGEVRSWTWRQMAAPGGGTPPEVTCT